METVKRRKSGESGEGAKGRGSRLRDGNASRLRVHHLDWLRLKAGVPVCGMETATGIVQTDLVTQRLKAGVPVCGMETFAREGVAR